MRAVRKSIVDIVDRHLFRLNDELRSIAPSHKVMNPVNSEDLADDILGELGYTDKEIESKIIESIGNRILEAEKRCESMYQEQITILKARVQCVTEEMGVWKAKAKDTHRDKVIADLEKKCSDYRCRLTKMNYAFKTVVKELIE